MQELLALPSGDFVVRSRVWFGMQVVLGDLSESPDAPPVSTDELEGAKRRDPSCVVTERALALERRQPVEQGEQGLLENVFEVGVTVAEHLPKRAHDDGAELEAEPLRRRGIPFEGTMDALVEWVVRRHSGGGERHG